MIPRSVGRFFRTLFCSALLSPLPFFHAPTTVHAAQTPVIGEVMWAGSSLSSADEWLELWNNSDEPLVLAGYILRGASLSDITFNETHIIPARSTFLVANYAHDDEKSISATSVQLVTTAISLSNSALKIELLAPNGALIDSVGDGGTPPAGSSLPDKTSMIRTVDNLWISATSSANLDPGIIDLATPGFCDACTEPTIPEPLPEPEPIIDIPTTTEPIIEPPTSTEPVIETEAPTSTEPVLEPLVGTSSTLEIIPTSTEPIIETSAPTTELPTIEQPEPAPVVTTNPAPTPAPAAIATSTAPLILHLHAIFPAPESGDEWIELIVPTGTTLAQAENWSLHDASASIYRFTGTNERVSINGNIWHISLASARLNNGGDMVELLRPDGSVAERMSFPETTRGTGWRKNVNNTAWIQDPLPIVQTAPAQTPVLAPSPAILPPVPTIELPIVAATTTQTEIVNKTEKQAAAPVKPKTATKASNPAKPKINPVPPLVTIDMLTRLEPEIRVTLEGTVGTIPGILGKNQFTLHTPDGRGLLVRGTSKQVSPEFGSKIRLTGMLSLNDDGLSLKMLSKDKWILLDGRESIEPRIVDLLAPSQEDAWSLIQVTGTVLETGASKAVLELDGFPIVVKIRPVTGYRAQRLSKGDLVRVTGLIDTRGEEPFLYPRQTPEIEILSRANLAPVGKEKAAWPAWTPFGAAGLTIAVTEGYKRLKRLAKDRKLKKLAALAQ